MQFKIGELIFGVNKGINFPEDWLCFQVSGEKNTDIKVQFVVDKNDNDNCFNETCFHKNIPYLCIDRHTSDYLIAERHWSCFYLHVSKLTTLQLNRLCFIAVRSAMIYRQGIFMHAALIDWKGYGIMFTGASGAGKSTQADLWAREKNARVINGDVTLVKKTGNRYSGYGSPWHGNSPYCENMSLPICAVVVLEQSSENRLTRLTGAEMIMQMLNNVFIPHWLQDFYSLILDILDELLGQVPVYLLKNKANGSAVRLLAEELFSDAFSES